MAGRQFPPEFLPQLLARVDLAELIGRYVPIKKAGHEYKACCPFHNEKTPSFTISPQKGFYHCFGCGAHGTAIGFLMEYGKYSFLDAVEELAKQAGMDMPRRRGAGSQQDYESLYACMEAACGYYEEALAQSAPAQAYLQQRGLSADVCTQYRIGYAPAGYDNIERRLADRFPRKVLLKVGLLSQKDDRVYDKFRHRLMFPIRDMRGRVVAFGGRVIDPDDKPKYMNSPETPLFHKGRMLYGLHELQKRRGKIKYLVLTEGYMDVVGLAQAGVPNAVATLGTATTEDHVRLMSRFCRVFVFCFDGDRAGREAGWRALEHLLPVLREGDEARFAFMPEGEDPDSFIRKRGKEAWRKFLGDAMPLEEYFFTHLTEGLDLELAAAKSALVGKARPLLRRMGDAVFRDLLAQRLAGMTGLGVGQLRLESAEASPERSRAPVPRGRRTHMQKMMRLLLEFPGLAQLAPPSADLRAIHEPGFSLFARIVDLAHKDAQINSAGIVESFRGEEEEKHLHSLLRWRPVELSDTKQERDVRGIFRQGMDRFRLTYVKQQISELSKLQIRGEVLSPDQHQQLEALKQQRDELRGPNRG